LAAQKVRVLVGKPGLDGHDRGAKVIAQMFRNSGYEVIYTGLHHSIEQIVLTAIEEDVDVIGVSVLSGSHLQICKELLEELKKNNCEDIVTLVGGIISKKDVKTLYEMGIDGVFPVHSTFEEILSVVEKKVKQKRQLGVIE
jgi:methylmalonyl-CoA mutase C-terminal domain/subunit